MMHPDQIYNVRQLQHHDLRMEVAQARTGRDIAGDQAAGVSARLAMWLRRLGARLLRVAGVSDALEAIPFK